MAHRYQLWVNKHPHEGSVAMRIKASSNDLPALELRARQVWQTNLYRIVRVTTNTGIVQKEYSSEEESRQLEKRMQDAIRRSSAYQGIQVIRAVYPQRARQDASFGFLDYY